MATAIVVDVSLAAAFLLREPEAVEFDVILKQVAEGRVNIYVPALFPLELLSILVISERRKRITAKEMNTLLSEWEIIPIVVDTLTTPAIRHRILTLAHEHHLTAHDAAYLELAERLHAKLSSLDSDILKLKRKYGWIS